MKPVKFYRITAVGEPSKPKLTPVTRRRLQTSGLKFFGITEDNSDVEPKRGVSFFQIRTEENEPAPKPKHKPSLDELFNRTVNEINSRTRTKTPDDADLTEINHAAHQVDISEYLTRLKR